MDKLTGNMPTENIIDFFTEKNIETGIREDYFLRALKKANEVFH